MGLLGLENLFDGDRTKSIAARTLLLSETLPPARANLGRTAGTSKSTTGSTTAVFEADAAASGLVIEASSTTGPI